MYSRGFTLVELLLTMGIFAVLATMLTINIVGTQRKTLVAEGVDVLIADLRSQQAKAMVGAGESDYGVYFESDAYVMFAGSSYDSENPSNSRVELPGEVNFSNISWPSAQIIFEKISGEVVNYQDSADSVTVEHSGSGARVIELNKYGAITSDE